MSCGLASPSGAARQTSIKIVAGSTSSTDGRRIFRKQATTSASTSTVLAEILDRKHMESYHDGMKLPSRQESAAAGAAGRRV